MLTATSIITLAGCDAAEMRRRAGSLEEVPEGGRAVVRVGNTNPEPAVVWVLVTHERRLHLDIEGAPRAARKWVWAIATNLGTEVPR